MRRGALGLVAALVLVAAAHGAGDGRDVAIPGRVFAPGELDALVGETVTWRNSDRATHTVTSDDDLFDSGHLGSGASFAHAFPQPGTFAYHCRIHRAMRGVVRVYALILNGPPRALPPGWAVQLGGVAPTPGGQVLLERLGGGAVTVAQATAAADGAFTFTQRPLAPGAYRARAGAATSPTVHVAVKPNVTVALAAGRVEIAATPRRPRSRVLLQRYDRERFDWVTIATGALDSASRAALRVPPLSGHARVVVRGRGGWADGISRTLLLTAGR